ncbi:MAG: trypsin-like peptidase domain-containing protein [Micrococcales bacterium]|nr:trypsin-like peptidase domain-containing protein [Micrococcales bacterium]
MTDERHPEPDRGDDYWAAQPEPAVPGAQAEPVEPDAQPAPDAPEAQPLPVDATQEVPLDHTREVSLDHTREVPAQPQAQQPTAGEPLEGGAHAAYPMAQGARQQWPPAPAPAQNFPPTVTAPPAKVRRGPSWPGVLVIALVSAMLAGALGGLLGGWLASTGKLRVGSPGSSIPTAGAGATSRPEGSIANIAAKALPSVVTVQVQGSSGQGTGSGFVLDTAGHIITNNHVVDTAASGGTIIVQLSNGDEEKATIVGRDVSYDLAVLKVARTDLTPLTLGASADVVVGDPVIAVGAPLGLDSTVTTGIVSALGRPVVPGTTADDTSYISAIQTDAAINPGNSGGPLLDAQGRVIGVNSAIARAPGSTGEASGNIGVGFAIPSDQVKRTAEQLISKGKADHPVIGVMLDSRYTGEGVKIADDGANGEAVTKDGPADKAGLEAGDVIVEFDGKRVTDADELIVAIRAKSIGDRVSLTVLRGNERIDATMVLQGSGD